MIGVDGPARQVKPPWIDRPSTTDGRIALFNLGAQIEALQQNAHFDDGTVESRAALAELLTLRGLILGRIADYERAETVVQRLGRAASPEPAAALALARIHALFHRFAHALDELDRAERLSLNVETANGERAAIFQALGRYDEASAIWEEAANRRPCFESLGALAGLCAERGEIHAAQRLFEDSLLLYRGVSPFPLALLDFQLGRMWMSNDRLDEARTSFHSALRRVPAYAPAQGHLAEVEAELGETEAAIARLYPLAALSDDPDYAAQLARILRDAGRIEESRRWRQLAAARYDELIAAYPEAFADHAAEFWLAAGADPMKALGLARMNFEVRPTPRAFDLLAQAAAASGRPAHAGEVH